MRRDGGWISHLSRLLVLRGRARQDAQAAKRGGREEATMTMKPPWMRRPLIPRLPKFIIVSIVWTENELHGLVFTRRHDGASCEFALPSHLKDELQGFDRGRLLRLLPQLLVFAGLCFPYSTFPEGCDVEDNWSLRNGSWPALPGEIRYFGGGRVGMDIDEFLLVYPEDAH